MKENFTKIEQITVKDIVNKKNIKNIQTISAQETIFDCARRMQELNVDLMLVEDEERPAVFMGVVTERDLVRRVIVDQWDPQQTTVKTIMTPNPEKVKLNTPLIECVHHMKEFHIRHLLVENEQGHLVQVISQGDVIRYLFD